MNEPTRVECNDGFSFSLGAGEGYRSCPEEDDPEEGFTHVEIGVPSNPDPLIQWRAEEWDYPTKTVYNYVRSDVLMLLLKKHRGIASTTELPKLKRNPKFKPEYHLLDIRSRDIGEDLLYFIKGFGAEIQDDSFDYPGTHCTHGQGGVETVISHISKIQGSEDYKILFAHTAESFMPALGTWKVEFDFPGEEEDYTEEVEVDMELVSIETKRVSTANIRADALLLHKEELLGGFEPLYYTKLHIEITSNY